MLKYELQIIYVVLYICTIQKYTKFCPFYLIWDGENCLISFIVYWMIRLCDKSMVFL